MIYRLIAEFWLLDGRIVFYEPAILGKIEKLGVVDIF